MASLTTGLIKNTGVSGMQPSSTLSVRICNNDQIGATIRINGFYFTGTTKTEYVLDIIALAPGEVANNNYYAQFEAIEFLFITSADAVEVSVWGKDYAGGSTVVHNVLPTEFFPMGIGEITVANGMTNSSALNQIYVPNSNSNYISVIEGKTNTLIGNLVVGSGPFGVGVNPVTNRIYVANYSSNNVSVIDGNTNAVITTVIVGTNPVGVGVNPITHKIYVTNQGSHNISVIDGITNDVISTITVGAFPEGVNVNPTTNQIYITNHGSNTISVINGSTNTVVATVDVGS